MVSERVNLHRYLLDRINLGMLDTLDNEEIATEIRPLVKDYIRRNNFPLNAKEINDLIRDITDEMLGLGPIEPLLADDTIADILINGHDSVYVERGGKLESTAVRFKDEDHLLRVINKIVSAVGRRVDELTPMVDARLDDGSRILTLSSPPWPSAARPSPFARPPGGKALTMADWRQSGLTEVAAKFLEAVGCGAQRRSLVPPCDWRHGFGQDDVAQTLAPRRMDSASRAIDCDRGHGRTPPAAAACRPAADRPATSTGARDSHRDL